ncbi:AMIN-like domain-containing (lipo)protein [Allokutzneria oryzae]|uniref:AMIN-like domain-containing protein n=1 Tax=Allokutzneria oryzae TaxID=1378989 RepID=A0ABV5ZXC1_9PSEU
MTSRTPVRGLRRAAAVGAVMAGLLGALAPAASAAPASVQECEPFTFYGVQVRDAGTKTAVDLKYSRPVQDVTVRELTEPPIQDGSGDRIKIKGTDWYEVRMLCGYDWYGNPYHGPRRVPGRGGVEEVVLNGDFEGTLSWVIGTKAGMFPTSIRHNGSTLTIEFPKR